MIEAYRIGVSMFLDTNIGTALPKMIEGFEALNRILKEAQANAANLGAAMRGIARAEPGIRTLAMAVERLHQAQSRAAESARALNAGVTNIPSGGAAAASMAAAAMAASQPNARQGGGGARGGALVPLAGGPRAVTLGNAGALALINKPIDLNFQSAPTMPTHGEFAQAGIGFGLLGAALLDFTKNAIEARAEVEHQLSTLRTMGFSRDQSDRALSEAQRLQRDVPGMSVSGGLHVIQDTMALLQHPEDALNPGALTKLAQTAIVLQGSGKGDAISSLFKAIQAGELRGALAGPDGEISQAGLSAFLRNVENTTVQTGGRVGPAEILQFLKSSNAAGAMLTDPALFADSIMPILSMGAAKAGSALQGLSIQFASGKMSEATANMLADGGLLNLPPGAKVKDYKVGIGQFRFPQEVLPDARMAQEHPYDFIEKVLLPFIDKYDAAHGGLAADPAGLMAQRMATSQQLSSRIPGGAMIGDVIRNYLLVQRDRNAIAGTGSRDAFAERQSGDPNVKMQALTAALNGLFVALGGPIMDTAIKGIRDITVVLNAVSAWAETHPKSAGQIMDIVVVLGAMSSAVGVLSLALFFVGPMVKVLTFLGPALTGAASGTTMFGIAVSGLLKTLGAIGMVGALAPIVSQGADSAFGWIANHLKERAYSIGGESDQHAADRHAAASAAHQAISNFSMFDRSTWSDPDAHWWNMSPKMPPSQSSTPSGPVPVVVTNGRDLVGGVTAEQARQASRPPSGTSGVDIRRTPIPTGLPVSP